MRISLISQYPKPPKNIIDNELIKWQSQNRNKELSTDIIEAIREKWISKDKICKLLGFFPIVRLQQDWKAAENNRSLLAINRLSARTFCTKN